MKAAILILCLSSSLCSCAALKEFRERSAASDSSPQVPESDLSREDRKLTYVVDTTLKRDEAYQRAKAWVARTYSSRDPLALDERSQGHFIFKAVGACEHLNADGEMVVQEKIHYTLEFEAKAKKAKITFEDLTRGERGEIIRQDQLEDFAHRCLELKITSFKSALTKTNSDW